MKTSTKWLRVLLLLSLIVAGIVVGVRSWWKHRYPYGCSHICNKQMGWALRMYADEHDGHFPSGGETPEASLCLLYKYINSPELMAGKAASVQRAAAVLEKGGVLGPNECNWYYVEGLTRRKTGLTSDNPALLVLWDKVPGLGHNCERLPAGGHEVLFSDGHAEFIQEPDWLKFLADQRAKMPKNAKFPDIGGTIHSNGPTLRGEPRRSAPPLD